MTAGAGSAAGTAERRRDLPAARRREGDGLEARGGGAGEPRIGEDRRKRQPGESDEDVTSCDSHGTSSFLAMSGRPWSGAHAQGARMP